MNYHSFIEGASENRELGVPAEFGPGSTGGGQPGFAVVAMNTSGAFISPVAQVPLRIASQLPSFLLKITRGKGDLQNCP